MDSHLFIRLDGRDELELSCDAVKSSLFYSLFLSAAVLISISLPDVSSAPKIAGDSIHVVLGGDHADPTIVRDGEDFYLTYTSYEKYPGLKIWHSRNLVDWKPIGYALHEYVGSVWAPEFIKHGDLFYIYFPTSTGKNFVTTASDPRGPWSKPVELEVSGIDPGHIVDPEGNRYIYLNGGKFAHLAEDGLSVTKDAEKKYEGWIYPESWEVECFCLESPKLLYRNGYYYLTSAQGGTAGPPTSHMAVSARARYPEGPWEDSPHNPIVHTWSRDERLWSKGHGTVFDDAEGNWYIIYHAYLQDHLSLGRHVLIEAVEWTDDGWFKTVRDSKKEAEIVFHANERIHSDDFSGSDLDLQWQLMGLEPPYDQYRLFDDELIIEGSEGGMITLQVNPEERNYEAAFEFAVEGDNVEVGVALYYSDTLHSGIGLRDGQFIRVSNARRRLEANVDATSIRFMKVRLRDQVASFFYSSDGESWTKHSRSYEVSGYQHNALGGFSYIRPVLYVKGGGIAKVSAFHFDAF